LQGLQSATAVGFTKRVYILEAIDALMSALTSAASAQDIQRYFFSGPEPEADRKPLLATSGLLVARQKSH